MPSPSHQALCGNATSRAPGDSSGPALLRPESALRFWAPALVAATLAAQLSLVWGFEYFPSVDGPAHVHLAHAMYEALRGDAFYGSMVQLNDKLNPNMAAQAILVALMAVAPPFVAEKIWLSLYFVSFAAAGAYTLAGINRNSLCLLPLLALCSMSFTLAFGFYNFSFSTVIFIAWFGFWWRHRDTFGVGVIAGHALFAAAAYFTHIFAFVVSLAGIGMTALAAIVARLWRDRNVPTPPAAKWHRPVLSYALPPLLGSIPEIIACLHFLLLRFGEKTAAGAKNLTAEPERLLQLLAATSLVPYDRMELAPAFAFVLAILFLLRTYMRHGRELKESVPFAACFAGFLVLYFVMPQQWIVRWMPYRFQPIVFVALLFWLAALIPAVMKRSQWQVIACVGLTILFVSVAVKAEVFARLNGYYREYASAAPHIAENSTLVGLRLHRTLDGRPFAARVAVFIQAGSRIASERHSVDLKNFQGQSSDHPVQFRPGVAATVALGGDSAIVATPPRVDLMAYERQTGRPIDYVLLYGFRHAVEDLEALARLDAQLRGNYQLIHVSKPSGFVQLYSRRPAVQ